MKITRLLEKGISLFTIMGKYFAIHNPTRKEKQYGARQVKKNKEIVFQRKIVAE